MMKIAALFALLGTVLFCCCGNVEAFIITADQYTPADNCSEAYIQLQRKHFGCINGSLAYCSRGVYNYSSLKRYDDINNVSNYTVNDPYNVMKVTISVSSSSRRTASPTRLRGCRDGTERHAPIPFGRI